MEEENRKGKTQDKVEEGCELWHGIRRKERERERE